MNDDKGWEDFVDAHHTTTQVEPRLLKETDVKEYVAKVEQDAIRRIAVELNSWLKSQTYRPDNAIMDLRREGYNSALRNTEVYLTSLLDRVENGKIREGS